MWKEIKQTENFNVKILKNQCDVKGIGVLDFIPSKRMYTYKINGEIYGWNYTETKLYEWVEKE